MLFGATVEETCAFDSAGETIEAAETDAAVAEEEEICGEARALGRPVEAADTDVAAAEEEACGEARALEDPVEATDTDVAAAEEETCGGGSRARQDVLSRQPTLMSPQPKRRPAGKLARKVKLSRQPLSTLKLEVRCANKMLQLSASDEPQGIDSAPNAERLSPARSIPCNS